MILSYLSTLKQTKRPLGKPNSKHCESILGSTQSPEHHWECPLGTQSQMKPLSVTPNSQNKNKS